MNIYIRPDLEVELRKQKSMSGLINELLDQHFKGPLAVQTERVRKIIQDIPEPSISNTDPGGLKYHSKSEQRRIEATEKNKPLATPTTLENKLNNMREANEKVYAYCKHGSVVGFCKKGCK